MPSRYVKKLRGPVDVTYSTRLAQPSWHLDPACPGLERTPEEARGRRTFADVVALGLDDDGRLCRMCSLEPVLRSTLRPRRGGQRTFATFNAEPVAGPSDRIVPVSPSGQRRIRRLARTLGLHVCTTTAAGITATGDIDPTGMVILRRNLRTYDLGTTDPAHPDESTIETFWALTTDTGTSRHDDLPGDDLWHTARLLNT